MAEVDGACKHGMPEKVRKPCVQSASLKFLQRKTNRRTNTTDYVDLYLPHMNKTKKQNKNNNKTATTTTQTMNFHSHLYWRSCERISFQLDDGRNLTLAFDVHLNAFDRHILWPEYEKARKCTIILL